MRINCVAQVCFLGQNVFLGQNAFSGKNKFLGQNECWVKMRFWVKMCFCFKMSFWVIMTFCSSLCLISGTLGPESQLGRTVGPHTSATITVRPLSQLVQNHSWSQITVGPHTWSIALGPLQGPSEEKDQMISGPTVF